MSRSNSSNSNNNNDGLHIGFIGFGTIASAIATGMAKQTQVPIASITVTRRSQAKSTALHEQFPTMTHITDDVQVIIDQATDLIFLCLLPETLQSVLQTVSFDKNSTVTVISVVASSDVQEIAQWTNLPLSRMGKMICTPSIAHHQGVSLVLPGTKILAEAAEEKKEPEASTSSSSFSKLSQLLEATGGMVLCASPHQMNILMTPFCAMGPIYGLLQQHANWLVKQGGIDHNNAQLLITKQYHAIVHDALIPASSSTLSTSNLSSNNDRLQELIDEQTPNGLNEQALRNWSQLGALDSYTQVLDAMVDRLEGRTDGSV